MTRATSTQSQIINQASGQADAFAALLSVIGILPAIDCLNTLATCSSLANDVASELAALIGGAA